MGALDRSAGTNWVEQSGGLPHYIEKIAKSLHEKRGFPISRAIATAVSMCKRWAAGGEDVNPDTRAKAAAAVAEWETKRARARAKASVDLAATADDVDLVLDLAYGDHRPPYDWKHGYVPVSPQAARIKAKKEASPNKGKGRRRVAGEGPTPPKRTPAQAKAADDSQRGRGVPGADTGADRPNMRGAANRSPVGGGRNTGPGMSTTSTTSGDLPATSSELASRRPDPKQADKNSAEALASRLEGPNDPTPAQRAEVRDILSKMTPERLRAIRDVSSSTQVSNEIMGELAKRQRADVTGSRGDGRTSPKFTLAGETDRQVERERRPDAPAQGPRGDRNMPVGQGRSRGEQPGTLAERQQARNRKVEAGTLSAATAKRQRDADMSEMNGRYLESQRQERAGGTDPNGGPDPSGIGSSGRDRQDEARAKGAALLERKRAADAAEADRPPVTRGGYPGPLERQQQDADQAASLEKARARNAARREAEAAAAPKRTREQMQASATRANNGDTDVALVAQLRRDGLIDSDNNTTPKGSRMGLNSRPSREQKLANNLDKNRTSGQVEPSRRADPTPIAKATPRVNETSAERDARQAETARKAAALRAQGQADGAAAGERYAIGQFSTASDTALERVANGDNYSPALKAAARAELAKRRGNDAPDQPAALTPAVVGRMSDAQLERALDRLAEAGDFTSPAFKAVEAEQNKRDDAKAAARRAEGNRPRR